jgi:large subunit ribosomal protein L25
MAKTLSLKAQTRKNIGRASVKAVRRSGHVPGILYGKKSAAQPIEINEHELTTVLHKSTSENVLVDLELDSKADKHLVMVQDVQHHPLEDYIIHIDLHEIARDEVLHAEVPLRSIGEPVGIKSGGVFETLMRTLRVSCLPQDLPEAITIDVSGLEIGQSIHVGDVPVPANVTILNHKELNVFAVAAPMKEEEPAPAAAAAATEPEVINEKKDEAGAAEGKTDGKTEAKADAKGGKADAKKEKK